MAASGLKWRVLRQIWKLLIGFVVLASAFVIANPGLRVGASAALAAPFMEQEESSYGKTEGADYGHVRRILNGLWHKGQGQGQVVYKHVWPEMEFGWRIVVGTIVGFLGAAFGSVGGVGGGGIFVPMLTLIIGFDAKSSIAISKCIITGAAAATVYYNLKERHPTLELPIIDYDLALLFQPMLVLGISVGVALNVILSEWMITILLIIIFLFTSTKSFLKGVETWKKETISKKEAARRMASQGDGTEEVTYNYKPPGETNGLQAETKESKKSKVSMLQNVYWKELGLLFTVWTIVLALQIAKNYSRTCSAEYWVLNILQIPVAAGVTAYEAVSLYKGRRKIASKGDSGINWKVHKLVLYSACGMLAGIIGGLLGLGGGFILGPLFLEMGIPPQVSSATSTFAMTFSASMSAIEYYLLKRFPVPYALYFFAVGTIAALVGQHVVGKLIRLSGRASVIIFILSLTIFVSAITLGGVGLSDMIKRFERKEYMGFDTLC